MTADNEIIAERRAKLNALRESGIAFPNDFRREHLAGKLHEQYDSSSREELESQAIQVAVAGRMMLKRSMGKLTFATLQDMSGRIQLYVSDADFGQAAHEDFKSWDLGD
ncbi:MAG: OB-fold nucleic acid binding domain-containing protein, partial [Gammaproteobacteria bacterium]